MSRDDLLKVNAEIVGKAATETLKYSPDAIYVVLTNPLDTMAYLAMKMTKLPRNRVIGQAGILDSARMRAFVALETGVSVENINCYVLGGHGAEMVPLTRHSNIAGIPLKDYIPADKLEEVFQPFVQADSRRTAEGEGTGIGLTIVKRVTELMGGSLTVESTVGQGTTFHLRFPDVAVSGLSPV